MYRIVVNFGNHRLERSLKILILGSKGQIGSFLESFLRSRGFEVIGIDLVNGDLEDLRYMNARVLDSYLRNVDFVFFLAYDVGGSSYLQDRQGSFSFISNNSLIMNNCFSSLQRIGTPFIFASSQMSNMTFSNYGVLKAIGERYTQALGGITVKFWNVYGYETDREKFHVISDFVRMAIENSEIRMKTTGEESRDFLFARDCCEGLYELMMRYPTINKRQTYDLASGVWTTIHEVAEIIALRLNVPVIRGGAKDSLQQLVRNEPRLNQLEFWSAKTKLKDGVSEIIQMFEART